MGSNNIGTTKENTSQKRLIRYTEPQFSKETLEQVINNIRPHIRGVVIHPSTNESTSILGNLPPIQWSFVGCGPRFLISRRILAAGLNSSRHLRAISESRSWDSGLESQRDRN